MRKIFPLSALIAFLLVACGKEKDAEYYFNNPNELREVMTQCETKLDGAIKKHQEIFEMEIKSDADLETLKQQVNQAIAEVEELKKDKMCNEILIAGLAIQIDNLKRAQLEFSNILETTGDEIIAGYKRNVEIIEARYNRRKLGNETMNSYFKKDKEENNLTADDLFKK